MVLVVDGAYSKLAMQHTKLLMIRGCAFPSDSVPINVFGNKIARSS